MEEISRWRLKGLPRLVRALSLPPNPHLTSSFLYLQQRQLIYSRVVCVKNVFILQKNHEGQD